MIDYNVWKNKYVLVGEVNGIERKWLNNANINAENFVNAAKNVFDKMGPDEVFGGLVHNHDTERPGQRWTEEESFYAFLEFLNEKDEYASRSRTLRELIENKVLPEEKINIQLEP